MIEIKVKITENYGKPEIFYFSGDNAYEKLIQVIAERAGAWKHGIHQ